MSDVRRGRKYRRGRKTAWTWWVIAAALVTVVLFVALANGGLGRGKSRNELPAGNAADLPLTLSAWIVDWQWEAGVADLEAVASGLNGGVQAFAAYFGADASLYYTNEDQKAWPEVLAAAKRAVNGRTLLTVVNDRYETDGSSGEQKDPALITELMASESSRGKHMSELLEAVAAKGFDGLELDYERVPNGAWETYGRFIGDLYGRLHAEGKTLRVVLESRAPLEKLNLPAGPDYVMMAYNLYGGFSGPGPKADAAFISQLAARMESLPGDNAIALSLGGFDWTADKQAVSVTEVQAAELAKGGSAEPASRDDASGSLHFRYTDGAGITHTVWYADAETLKRWIGAARSAGVHDIALWRLGGLSEEMREWVKGLRNSSIEAAKASTPP
ncbi:glycosyl hydrolase family 18 protein [Paenibacillus sacheonensis]|uniref:Glycosyl hydrolase n=1 Tax=Paenibacillus sacheonensis TaxID=742054 RepID=A0A7X5C263_9BACL|nr:glycosyl hydrolase family 18 protein [Paenibacillus sacheonensis]MBM7567121.1 hypothetical protein [Paenibacillus sacheonensis]NBC70950.1 glycosyl hydrolase [Paenibacillus sacheonensis]